MCAFPGRVGGGGGGGGVSSAAGQCLQREEKQTELF